jgi:signal transduction histidine kinase
LVSAVHFTDQAIYRDAFRRTDEFAAIIEVAPPGRLIDASDGLLAACHLDRDTALGRPLDRIFNAATAARLMDLGRAAVANDRGNGSLNVSQNPPTARCLDRRLYAHPLSEKLAFLRASDNAPARNPRRDALLDEVGALSDGLIYIFDVARQRTSYMNSHLNNLLGLPPGRALRVSDVLPRVHPDDAGSVSRHVERFPTLADGEVVRHSYRLLRYSDDTWRQIENRYAALSRDTSGAVRTVIGCAFDVTDRDLTLDRTTKSDIRFEVEEHERRRIARELHDSTAQHLVAADLMVGVSLRQRGERPDNALASARATLAQALREIRTLSFLLHTPSAHKGGFARMVRGFAEGFAQRSNLRLKIEFDSIEEVLSPAVELILFRVCQEAFMNVRRHANASSVTLRYHASGADAVLEVDDNGVGMDSADETHLGVGIESMRTRLQEIGGSLELENTGRGTLVRARAPRNIVN